MAVALLAGAVYGEEEAGAPPLRSAEDFLALCSGLCRVADEALSLGRGLPSSPAALRAPFEALVSATTEALDLAARLRGTTIPDVLRLVALRVEGASGAVEDGPDG